VIGSPLIRFDMSEYMEKHAVARLVGSPPGYVGYEEGGLLTEAVTKQPFSVILMDEIEKAHPDLNNILLQVMDNGTLTDSHGQSASFRNAIVILTTNAGAADANRPAIGLSQGSNGPRADLAMEAIKRVFTPEFINRLDAIIQFEPLTEDVMLDVVAKFVRELQTQLSEKRVSIEAKPDALRWLMKKGFDPIYGARPLARTIDENVKKRIVDELLFGELESGGHIDISVASDGSQLELRYSSMSRTLPAPAVTSSGGKRSGETPEVSGQVRRAKTKPTPPQKRPNKRRPAAAGKRGAPGSGRTR
jgi:ATP-dependent Clp protease ATP-binding subunit ClpA